MKYLYLSLLFISIIACKTPTELLEAGKYRPAFSNAVAEVKKRKNVEENKKVIKQAAKMKVDEALLYSSVYSVTDNVSDWIKTQTKLYELLVEIGKANLLLSGHITEPYDELCNEKKNIDYQIVEHFYDEGHDHLDRFYNDSMKVNARNAYASFVNCEKYDGSSFFPNLAFDKELAHQNGIVYYTSDYGYIGSALFVKPVPQDSNITADCDINIRFGFVSFNTSESSSAETETKEIETGTKSVTDTSGITTRTPIYETVSAVITTKKVSVSAQMYIHVKVQSLTEQCNIKSRSISLSDSDSYEEVSVSGDKRALSSTVSTKSGNPNNLRSTLEQDIKATARSRIRSYFH